MISQIAPAKINLYLHVGGVRRDRLHALDSLFVFAESGDVVSVTPAPGLSLLITGPFAAPLLRESIEDNLVLQAARLLKRATGFAGGAAITLEKRLPIASGVGGGSADAAAALRALVRLWRVEISERALARIAFRLGADVPACLDTRPVYVGGAGERVDPGPHLPPLWVCLVNPNIPMPTGKIFRAFDQGEPTPPPPTRSFIRTRGYADISGHLRRSRNDLEIFAVRLAPIIRNVIDRLAARPGSLGARMSGSGATVFGLFTSASAAARAAMDARGQGWWSLDAKVIQSTPSPHRIGAAN